MPPTGTVRVRGLRELDRAFRNVSKEMQHGLREELRAIGEPVRVRAEHLATEKIRNVGDQWSQMRLGVTSKVVYIAPKQRRRRGSPRPNFGTLLIEEAMIPALADSEEEVVMRLDMLLGRLGEGQGF